MENKVLTKYNNGQKSLGSFTHLKSMQAVEAMGLTGLDYAVIDMEHCPIDIDEAAKYITAAAAADITPFVRVNEASRSAILRALDVGAMGIVVPCIESVQQVRELVGHAKFQPVGNRGYCMTRDGQWGYGPSYASGMNQYMDESNRTTLFIPQCETLGLLEHIEEAVAIDGVDGIMIGPYDLSIALGLPGQFQAPEFEAAVQRILKACKDANKISFIFTGNGPDTRARLDQGFDSAMVGLDLLVLVQSYQALVAEING